MTVEELEATPLPADFKVNISAVDIAHSPDEGDTVIRVLGFKIIEGSPNILVYTSNVDDVKQGWQDVPEPKSGGPEKAGILLADQLRPLNQGVSTPIAA